MKMNNAAQSTKEEADRAILREYYLENNFFTSAEGVLKVLSIVSCASLVGSSLVGERWAAAGAAGGAALAQCAVCVLHCLRLAAFTPMTCFYTTALCIGVTTALATSLIVVVCHDKWMQHENEEQVCYKDITVSCAVGAWLLLTAMLRPIFWDMRGVLDYVYTVLAVVSASLVTISAVITYTTVIKRWDTTHKLPPGPSKPNDTELDV